MKDQNLKSGAFAGVHHDGRTARVTFHSGDVWHYAGVSDQKMADWRNAESAGKFFHAHIKPHHEGTNVEG